MGVLLPLLAAALLRSGAPECFAQTQTADFNTPDGEAGQSASVLSPLGNGNSIPTAVPQQPTPQVSDSGQSATGSQAGADSQPAAQPTSAGDGGQGSQASPGAGGGSGPPTTLDFAPNLGPGNYTHGLSVTLVVLRNAGWSEQDVEDGMTAAGVVLKQCGIRINNVHAIFMDSPIGKVDLDSVTGNDLSNLAEKVGPQSKPTMFLFKSFGDGTLGYSFPKAIVVPGPHSNNIVDTSWVARNSRDSYPTTYSSTHHTSPPFSTEAHELGHLLDGDSGHVRDGTDNLMEGDKTLLSGRLTSAQCANFKANNSFVTSPP